jgi:hypothetical protein
MVKQCFSTSSELGHNSPRLQSGTSLLEAVLCSGAATERQPLRSSQRTYGAFLRPDIPLRTHAYMRVADRFTASTPPWTALFSSEAVQTRLIGAGVNPHSGELGTETMPLRTA